MGERSNGSPSSTRAEEIRQLLADEIVRGRLPPGLPLEEIELARKFGVSRTPVREAIRQLEATGLAEARPRRGAVVAGVTRERLEEMFLVMLELEALTDRISTDYHELSGRAKDYAAAAVFLAFLVMVAVWGAIAYLRFVAA